MPDYTDRELDSMAAHSLRSEWGTSIDKMQAKKARLLELAATQAQLAPLAPAREPRWLRGPVRVWDRLGQWCYALLYEETCYDRARSLPNYRNCKSSSWSFVMDRYFFLRPAF